MRVRHRLAVAAAVALLVTLAACSSKPRSSGVSSGRGNPLAGFASALSRRDAWGTEWLCRPGLVGDPCAGNLTATALAANGSRTVRRASATGSSRFDCFYVYPTTSPQKSVNATLAVQSAETAVAMAQAARFSQVCDVWAPMYRQVTVAGLVKASTTDKQAVLTAYDSVLSGWEDFLAHHDDGRPIVLIGHSQGASMLIRLVKHQVDGNAALRRRLVLAIMAGGNLAVPTGRTVGATFSHVPLCTRSGQTGCVIAYSTFPSEPPADSLFGRPGKGVSVLSGQTRTTGVQVACVDPAALGGGTGTLQPYFPSAGQKLPAPAVDTPWVTYPDLYTASCEHRGGASWLQVTPTAAIGGRPIVTESLGPLWGFHLDDINLPLGNLVHDTGLAEATYARRH